MGGDWDLVTRVAVWGVAFGVIGARALPRRHLVERGADARSGRGSSRCGRAASASGAGSSSGRSPARSSSAARARASPLFMDAVAPGLLLAQGIGRIGNWWNQELYGKPTTLPWGAQDRRRAPPADPKYLAHTTFHPTFLYELIWDLVGVARPALGRPALPDPAAGALRALRRLVLLRPLLRGAAADRPGAPHRRAAPERLGARSILFVARRRLLRAGTSARRRGRGAREPKAPRAAEDGADDGDPEGPRPVARVPCRAMPVRRPRARAGPRRVRGAVRPPALARSPRGAAAARDRSRGDRRRVRRASRRAGRARPRRLRRVPDPDPRAARAEGARDVPGGGRRARRARARGGGRGARAAPRRVPAREGGGRLPARPARRAPRPASSGSGPRRSRPKAERKLAPQAPEQLAAALRLLAVEPPEPSLAHMALRFPPVSQFLDRWRALLRRRSRFDFDQEVAGLSRVEVAVAFLALLELRKQNEIAIAQAAPFAPIRISRADAERSLSWNVPPPDHHRRHARARARTDARGAARRRLAAAARRPSSPPPPRTDPAQVEEALAILEQRYSRGTQRDRARARRRRVGVPRVGDGVGGVRATVREAGRARACRRRRSRRSRSSRTSGRCRARRSRASAASTSTASSPGSSSAGSSPRAAATNEFGAIRYRTTPLFERIFGLESLAALPRVDDLGADVDEIREPARGGRGEAPRLATPIAMSWPPTDSG